MLKNSLFSTLIFVFLFSFEVTGQDNLSKYSVVTDLERSLLIYNSDQKSYVPYAYNSPFNENVASFVLNLQQNKGRILFLCTQPESALFVDQKIVATQTDGGCLSLDIDSLRSVYKSPSLFVSLYNKDLDLDATTIQMVQERSISDGELMEAGNVVKTVPREFYPFKNFYIIGLLLILAIFSALKGAYPKIFSEFFNLGKIFSFRWREDSIIAGRAISSANLLFLTAYCAVLAFIILTLWYETGGAPQVFGFVEYAAFLSSFVSWMLLAILVFFFMVMKYLIIRISSSLLGFKELVNFHFLDFIRISQLFLLDPVIRNHLKCHQLRRFLLLQTD